MLIEGKSWLLDFQCDWPEWFTGKYNWKSFTVIELSLEHDVILGGLELVAAALGLRILFVYTYDFDTPLRVQLAAEMETYVDCKHDWKLEVDGPMWVCSKCDVSTVICKPED